jgi:hypothetical protein
VALYLQFPIFFYGLQQDKITRTLILSLHYFPFHPPLVHNHNHLHRRHTTTTTTTSTATFAVTATATATPLQPPPCCRH